MGAERDEDEDRLREDVRSLIAAVWRDDLPLRRWWAALADAGLSQPTWPCEYGGRALAATSARVVLEELATARAIAPPTGAVGTTLAGPTLLDHGSEAQKASLLPALVRGEESWCQLFSEPGAGSDLPSLSTRAERDGDRWVVSGQKVWNSGADIARRAMLLARTNPGVPKREGITYFLLDMDQPGVTVRRLKQINGLATFCEVFLDEVHVSESDVLGVVDAGWRVARTTLSHERAMVGGRLPKELVGVPSGELAGLLDEPVGDLVERFSERRARFSGNAVPARALIELARERGRAADPLMRQRLAQYHTLTELSRLTQQRARAAVRSGRAPGSEGSITKLAISQICRMSREISFAILGADATLWGSDAPYNGALQVVGLASCGVSIGGGTDEIQRNVVAERALGLPRDEEPDSKPFGPGTDRSMPAS
jgi:alkylation response protein AidB-like acyl-CoA dehydrogenase